MAGWHAGGNIREYSSACQHCQPAIFIEIAVQCCFYVMFSTLTLSQVTCLLHRAEYKENTENTFDNQFGNDVKSLKDLTTLQDF